MDEGPASYVVCVHSPPIAIVFVTDRITASRVLRQVTASPIPRLRVIDCGRLACTLVSL